MHHAGKRPRFTGLLKRLADVLLLAAAAHVEVRACRCDALGAVGKTLFDACMSKLTLFLGQGYLSRFPGQQPGNKQRFTLMTRHALAKRVEIVCGDRNDIARSIATFC